MEGKRYKIFPRKICFQPVINVKKEEKKWRYKKWRYKKIR
jgi:hypothetical protein